MNFTPPQTSGANASSSTMVAPKPLSAASLITALVGAIGGFMGFVVGDTVDTVLFGGMSSMKSGAELLLSGIIYSASIGVVIGSVLLAFDNSQSLRGKWHRDLLRGLPTFLGLSLVGGAMADLAYIAIQNSVTRALAWALAGLMIGVGIGALRRDFQQCKRGGLGGAFGGFIGGFIFNSIFSVLPEELATQGNGMIPRCIGLVIMGAMIGLLIRVAQDALRQSWLRGVSEGPYKGREYPLNVARVTVGPTEANDICLYRERELPPEVGAFEREGETWWWRGRPAIINGVKQSIAPLQSGDVIQFGANHFRFESRQATSVHTAGLPGYGAPLPYGAPSPHAPPAFGATPFDSASSTLQAPPDIHILPPAFLGAPSATSPSFPLHPSSATPPLANAPLSAPVSAPFSPTSPAIVGCSWLLRAPTGTELRAASQGEFIVGRAPDNALVVADDTVSSRHARLEVGGATLRITDLDSTNGTWVNGAKLTSNLPRDLHPGDLLRLGRTEWMVERG